MMTRTRRSIFVLSIILLVPLASAVLVLVSGCDDYKLKPTNEAMVTVTPQFITLGQGESREFRASGAVTYQWEIEDPTVTNATPQRWAVLSSTAGDRVVYTSVHSIAGEQNIVVLRVRGFFGATSGGTGTVDTVEAVPAEAYVTHVP